MKKFAMMLAALFALGMGLAQAQVNPDMLIRVKGQLADGNGTVLSDDAVQQLIGAKIYHETYVGATKQYNVGKQLITWGAIGAGVGFVTFVGGFVTAYAGAQNRDYTLEKIGIMGYCGGAALMGVGSTMLGVGIPLNVIGKSRLNWIADDYNQKQDNVSLRLTGCSAGAGLGFALVF